MAQFGAATTGREVVAAFPERVKDKTSSLESVRKAAKVILADRDITAIDGVFNNAGIITNDLVRTPDRFESQFAINHLSHFLLTNMLMPRLLTSTSPRVVNISSLGHKYYEPTFQDPHFSHIDPESYNPEAYAQSKGAQVLFSVALNRRYPQKRLRSFAVHPGNMDSGMYNHMRPEVLMDMAERITGRSLEYANGALTKTTEGGCATGLTAALAPDLPDGVFMNDCQVTKDPEFVAAWAQDAGKAKVCWRVSKEAAEQSVGVDLA
ncbi:short-chain dehydrogenase [Fusarium pseudocircinatum]|uniref:Short-chain dehydrogenase n=1 Tax=Fusarium pseudocircinatum TaxID=56676 RepID=A0A8H5L6E3_9HYPO|nr:short-chain dehydrogenase [Fusarium pseudocircinatum]